MIRRIHADTVIHDAPVIPPVPDIGKPNYRMMILRRADGLEAAGDALGAIRLRLTLLPGYPPIA